MDPIYGSIAGGSVLLLLIVFQVLVGARVIRFKGKLHSRIHRDGGYAVVVIAAFHGVFSAGTLLGWF